MTAACVAMLLFDADAETTGMTFESNGKGIRISNTNSVLDNATIQVPSNVTMSIDASISPSLPAGALVRLVSLDFGYIDDNIYGTHARRIELDVNGETFVSEWVVTNSTDKLQGKNGNSVDRLVYSFSSTNCVLVSGETYPIRFLDETGNEMTAVRYKVGKNADSLVDGIALPSNGNTYRPLMQLVGEWDSTSLSVAKTHVTSSYSGGTWFFPNDLGAVGTNCIGMLVSGHPVMQDIDPVTAKQMSASVLAEVPAGIIGDLFCITVTNSASRHCIHAMSNGDGTFLLTFDSDPDGTIQRETGFAAADISGTHIYTVVYTTYDSYDNVAGSYLGAHLYMDGMLVARDAGIYWSSQTNKFKIANTICFGAAAGGDRALKGMNIYAIDTDFSVYEFSSNSVARVFATFDFLNDFADSPITDRVAMFNNYLDVGTVSLAMLNGVAQNIEKTKALMRLFGLSALDGNGVTFKIGGIDVADGTIRLNVSPEVQPGNSLSVFGKAELCDRWRRMKVNPQLQEDCVSISDLADCRFFQIRAEEGLVNEGCYPVSAAVTLGNSANTHSESHITSAGVNGDIRLFTLVFDGGEDADYASSDYESLSLYIEGVRTGTPLRMTIDGMSYVTSVNGAGLAVFDGLAGISRGSTLAVDVVGDSASTTIDTTVLSNRAGVVSYKWGNGVDEPVVGGITNVMTMLANTPYGDGLGGSSEGIFRIPGIAKSTNGTIVAVYDCRYDRSGDLINSIDIAGNFSVDNGTTWTRPSIAIDVGNYRDGDPLSSARDIGDPCVVYSPADDKFFCMAVTGSGLYAFDMNHWYDSNGKSTSGVVLYSRGSGAGDSWGDRKDVKGKILAAVAIADEGQHPTSDSKGAANPILGILQGPGHGIALRNPKENNLGLREGTLVFPMQYFPKQELYSTSTHNKSSTFAAWTNDGGDTWDATAIAPYSETALADCSQENCIVELDDGSWVNMTKGAVSDQYKRRFYRTTDYRRWTCETNLPSNGAGQWVQGSCLWLGEHIRQSFGSSRYVACYSTQTHGTSRQHITLHFGRDTSSEEGAPGITWDCGEYDFFPEATILATTGNGMSYNSMVMLDDWTLGVLFEAFGHIYLRKVDVRPFL